VADPTQQLLAALAQTGQQIDQLRHDLDATRADLAAWMKTNRPQPQPQPPPPDPAPSPVVVPPLYEQLRQAFNNQRAQFVPAPAALLFENHLQTTAQQRANRLAQINILTHFPDGVDPATWAEQVGYPSPMVWEIIAWNFPDVTSVVAAWMNSQGHRADILEVRIKAVGVGVAMASNGNGLYWVADFGDVLPVTAKTEKLSGGRLGATVNQVFRRATDRGPWAR
jgi:uncharacterized protein YkwD